MPPALATYQQAASQIYEPQKAADITTAQANTASEVANEEALKPQVQTDYQAAVDNLTKSTNQNVAKINQLYTLRLGGNFSGLQGNDLGGMFAGAAKAQGVIETTRANKLNQIAVTETNLKNKLTADISAIGSKYQGLEADYANTNYSSAVKEFNTEQHQAFQDQIALARLGISQARLSQGGKMSQAEITSKNMQGASQFLNSKAGKDGHVNPVDWRTAATSWQNAGGSINDFVKSFGNFINQHKDHYVGYS